jgi:hypothetical protein
VVLGEAASRISEELKSATPDAPWREIVGIRVILAHAYFHIDRDIVSGGGLARVHRRATHAPWGTAVGPARFRADGRLRSVGVGVGEGLP